MTYFGAIINGWLYDRTRTTGQNTTIGFINFITLYLKTPDWTEQITL